MRLRGQGSEDDHDVVAEPDILGSLPHVESDLSRTLAGVAAIDFEDRVLQRQPGEAPPHGRLLVERNIGPTFGRIAGAEFHGRCRVAARPDVHAPAVRALHIERSRDMAVVGHLDKEQARARFYQFRLGSALLHLHAAFGVNVHREEDVGVQDGLQLGDCHGFIGIADGLVDAPLVGGRQGLPQVIQRVFQLAHLLRQGLQRDGRGRGMLMRSLLGGRDSGEN